MPRKLGITCQMKPIACRSKRPRRVNFLLTHSPGSFPALGSRGGGIPADAERSPEGETMRCYYNLVRSHHTITDEEGLEVADMEEAHTFARKAVRQMAQDGV